MKKLTDFVEERDRKVAQMLHSMLDDVAAMLAGALGGVVQVELGLPITDRKPGTLSMKKDMTELLKTAYSSVIDAKRILDHHRPEVGPTVIKSHGEDRAYK